MGNTEFTVEICLILDGEYHPNSDIHVGTFDSHDAAVKFAKGIDVQDPKMYECFVYEVDKNTSELLDCERIF